MAAKKTLKVTQTGSPIRRRKDQRQTLVGLGLNRCTGRANLRTRPLCAA